MKKTLFLIAAITFSLQIIAQNSPDSDTCQPVPWVNAVEQDNGNSILVTWDIPCDTCQVEKYRPVRVEQFDPCVGETPEDGGWIQRVPTTTLSFTDPNMAVLPPGYYAYGIEVVYNYCESVRIYSNIIYHLIFNYSLTINLSLENGGNPEGADISIDGTTLCTDSLSYFQQTDADGNAYFEEVMYGEYELIISKPGYVTDSIKDFILFKDSTIMVELQVGPDPPPTEFTIDSYGLASWTLPSLKNNQNTPLSYKIRLDDSLVAELNQDAVHFQFQSLHHNTEYKASISALYDWGESDIVDFTFITDFVGINENSENIKIDIFPNPATDLLTIQSNQEIQQIEVFNYLGQIVLEKSVRGKQVDMNTSTLEAGIYIVRLKTATASMNRSILIKR